MAEVERFGDSIVEVSDGPYFIFCGKKYDISSIEVFTIGSDTKIKLNYVDDGFLIWDSNTREIDPQFEICF